MHCHVYAPERRKRSAPDPLAGAVGPPDIEFRAGAVVSKPDAKGDKRESQDASQSALRPSAGGANEGVSRTSAKGAAARVGHLPASAPEEHRQGVPQGVG